MWLAMDCHQQYHIFISDGTTGISFPVGTTADVFVIQKSLQSTVVLLPVFNYMQQTEQVLTPSEKAFSLNIGLKRIFKLRFIMSDVTKPILGAVF